MTDPTAPPSASHPLEMILQLCAAAAPEPWYPSVYAKASGIVRDELDPHLNRLRLGGLVRLTDWMKDRGQGYVLTPEGQRVLQNPRDLAQLNEGRMPEARPTEEEIPTVREVPRDQWDRGGIILDDLQRPQMPVLTNLLLAINIVWFLVGAVLAQGKDVPISQYLSGSTQKNGIQLREIAHQLGSLSGNDLVEGQWWRLLACCFVHYGLIHLGANMLTLYFIGPMMERMWGRWRYLAIYLIAGLGGSCTAMIVNPNSQLGGASGALWGTIASQAVWIMMNRPYLSPEAASAWLRNLLTVFLLNAFVSMMPGISAAAHFGGGAIGAAAGYLANYQRFGTAGQRGLGTLGLALFPVLCLAVLLADMVGDPRWVGTAWPAETNDFLASGGDAAWSASENARHVYTQVLPLITNYKSQRRDPQKVEKTRKELEAARKELEQAAARLAKAGPYRTVAVEKARQDGIEYVQAEINLCRRALICLKGGESEKQEEKAMLAQGKQAIDLRAAWMEALRQVGLTVTAEDR